MKIYYRITWESNEITSHCLETEKCGKVKSFQAIAINYYFTKVCNLYFLNSFINIQGVEDKVYGNRR